MFYGKIRYDLFECLAKAVDNKYFFYLTMDNVYFQNKIVGLVIIKKKSRGLKIALQLTGFQLKTIF